MSGIPQTLQQVILYFSDPDNALNFAVNMRWGAGPITCPRCGCERHSFIATRRVWECKGCRKQFSVKLGTIFEDSPIGLDKWLTAMWMIANCKNGISSYEIHRDLGVTQKTAWFMLHRLRLAMSSGSLEKKFCGEIEADETFIGGKVKNMHKRSKRKIKAVNDGNWGKTVVLGLLQRETGEVRAKVAPSRTKHHVHAHIQEHVELGSMLYTDEHHGYDDLPPEIMREMVTHLGSYVRGRVHTNGIENFWSLLKRTLGGTYVSVDPAHLSRYIDEQAFRYNNRNDTDLGRFCLLAGQVAGRRITYKELTGASLDTATA